MSRAWPAMGTMMSVAAWGTGDTAQLRLALAAAGDTVELIDSLLSADRDDSEVAALNRARGTRAGARISSHLAAALGEALAVAEAAGRPWRGVTYDSARRTVRLAPGAALDLRATARGYALDRAADLLRGVSDSVLIDLGGQFLWAGPPTRRNVGLADPDQRLRTLAAVELRTGSAATTSADDPPAGAEGQRRASAVTVLAPGGTAAGAWSEVFFRIGCDAALSLAARLERWRVSLVCADSAGVRWTPDLEGRVLLPTAPASERPRPARGR